MATWKRLTDIGKSPIGIDLDTIAFMCPNGKGTEIHFNSGQTLTVRESPEAVARRRSPTRHERYRASPHSITSSARSSNVGGTVLAGGAGPAYYFIR
jgi:hypothetical protein